ncbi:CDP-diacylglycerol--glycerol-3-phosphate 3-phosphatidyltransferase [Borreliella yangtzensis]|uniref:CDP-diacylglycerol--glycerol-3-phosphate 3-phosphatidyltransferase n=1 Tax=Borreliella yangtzensis TaxID=683292 RepID=A0ABR6P8U7_9SPIR|nr:CDP-diacylglycerol--glycerol-3-phosphate 3-phosphatidyltransferase [Borreliella yangtzensis]MBB6042703.1 CDP-diacylglycerol--glycerol-3-phosphate 3-phosphatidyltransferase [Borreliella yangtzensis]WKC73664.1 CDP-diacylglycerol--glycerol-3-phosphate 3-phosphatidyltransferase [Borreliella yangtzensis]WKC74580.1 CDP-diacylglycerol--glycerol-3-phosphate 3-phosphatidyltransferase [Borreliella yangtzensis]
MNNLIKFITPNKITLARIVLSFIILILFFLENLFFPYLFFVMIWFLIIFNEFTDFIDGYIARKYGLVSNVGKILDPYADVLQHLTYFVFFFYKGITPYYFFVIFIYREISIGFVRNLIIQFNIVQQANFLGKLKSFLYAVCTFASLLLYTFNQLNFTKPIQNFISYILNFEFKFLFVVQAMYVCAALFAILSFLDYVFVFLNIKKYENK